MSQALQLPWAPAPEAPVRLAVALPKAPPPVDPVSLLPDYARMDAENNLAVIRAGIPRLQAGASVHAVAKWLASTAVDMPSVKTLERWLKDYQCSGIVGLAPTYRGKQRKERGWEARAQQLYNQPTRPAYATVAYWLRQEGFADASEHLVRRYLKALPSNLTETGKKRVGAHYYQQNIRPHVVRDNTVLPVGFIYEGDGHTCDVYVAHPATGRPFRPELTTWLDIRSGYVVAWWISESESAQTTLFSLSQALVAHNHVPAFVHTDPGSGFKAKLISHEVTGFLVRFSIQPMLALPGNAKGKGLQEGWFRWFEERCGKRFPQAYCGHDRTDDYLRHLTEKVKRGLIVLPTLAQYIDAVRAYVDAYNRTPQENLGCAPAALWDRLERVELLTPAEAVIRPRQTRTVRRWGIELDNRLYRAADLARFESREVIVEYSMHDDQRVWIHDQAGRFVCEATLVEKKAWLPASRIEEGQQRRLDGQRKRHLRAIEEQEARARMPLSAASVLEAIDAPYHEPAAISVSPLDQRHSVTAPLAPPAPSQALAPIDLTEVREAMEEATRPIDSPEQRFERAMRLEREGCMTTSDAHWLAIYQTSAEYASRLDLLDAFNAA